MVIQIIKTCKICSALILAGAITASAVCTHKQLAAEPGQWHSHIEPYEGPALTLGRANENIAVTNTATTTVMVFNS
jgi:hypothetical protein